MARILLVYSRPSSFIAIDRELLAESHEVQERVERRPWVNVFGVFRDVRRCDVVFAWFAYWHSFWPVTIAWLLRKPSLLVSGGYDTADIPAAGYGLQRRGLGNAAKRFVSRQVMRRASRIVVNSSYIRDEIGRNAGIAADRVDVVHHGVPDRFGSLPQEPRERLALTVGAVDRANLERKGLRPFVAAARLLPEVRFVVAGGWHGDAADLLLAEAPDNVQLTGWVGEGELADLYRRASVYVQASLHEGFGMSVAEAMLAGCIPVTSTAGALPEVVGDEGIQVERPDAESLAAAIERVIDAPRSARERARERALSHFPLAMRREGLERALAVTLAAGNVRA